MCGPECALLLKIHYICTFFQKLSNIQYVCVCVCVCGRIAINLPGLLECILECVVGCRWTEREECTVLVIVHTTVYTHTGSYDTSALSCVLKHCLVVNQLKAKSSQEHYVVYMKNQFR